MDHVYLHYGSHLSKKTCKDQCRIPIFTSHLSYVVLYILLSFQVNKAGSIQHYQHNISRSSGSLYIESRGYPTESYLKEEPYTEIWYLDSRHPDSYIQVYFEDFHISNESFIKIVDVKGTTPFAQPSFIYNRNRRPIFQSAGDSLIILFKTGKASKKYRENRGFRANIKWVKYHRKDWYLHDIPSTGYCGNVHIDAKNKSIIFKPRPDVINRYVFDCLWYIPARYMKISYVKLKNDPDRSGRQLTVYSHGHWEAVDSAAYRYTIGSPSQSDVLTSSSYLFLVRLVSKMENGDYIHIQFTNTTGQLHNLDAAPVVDIVGSQRCPFNRYETPVRCTDYWENPGQSDETCLYLPKYYNRCPEFLTTARCTHPKYDACDGYVDCQPNGADEKSQICSVKRFSELHWFLANVLAAAILIFTGWGCACRRRGPRRSCSEYQQSCCSLTCLETYTCDLGFLRSAPAKLHACCATSCPCCVKRSIRRGSCEEGDLHDSPSASILQVAHVPVVSISAGVDARIRHAQLLQTASLGRGDDTSLTCTYSDAENRWERRPSITSSLNIPLHALSTPVSSQATTSTCNTTTNSYNGLPTYEQAQCINGTLTVAPTSSSAGSEVNLLYDRLPVMGCDSNEPPPPYTDVIFTPDGEGPPAYDAVFEMPPDAAK